MRNNPNIPNELYYLDDNFTVEELRKYQLKDILAANNIRFTQTATKVELVTLFTTQVESRREEILREFKVKESKRKEEESKAVFGRGHRATQKPVKFGTEFNNQTKHSKKDTGKKTPLRLTRNSSLKDKDGFAIPAIPEKKPVPAFTAEDSFGEEEEDQRHTNRRDRDTKLLFKEFHVDDKTDEPTKTNSRKQSLGKPKDSKPSFNAEDSFASSDDYEEKRQVRKRLTRQRAVKIKNEDEDVSIPKKTPRKMAAKKKTVETDSKEADRTIDDEYDLDYQADTDESEGDDDDYSGKVDKIELDLLQKDQTMPVEALTAASTTTLNSSVMLNSILRNNILVYAAVMTIVFIIYLCSSQENVFTKTL